MPRKFRMTAPKGTAKKLHYGGSSTSSLTTAAVSGYSSTIHLTKTSTSTDTSDLPVITGISRETHTHDLVVVNASETQTDESTVASKGTQTDESMVASKGTQTDSLSIPPSVTKTNVGTQSDSSEVLREGNCLFTPASKSAETTLNEASDHVTLPDRDMNEVEDVTIVDTDEQEDDTDDEADDVLDSLTPVRNVQHGKDLDDSDDGECDIYICEGNNDERFLPLVKKHKGVFKDVSGKNMVAYYDQYYMIIRHVHCQWKLQDKR